MEIWKDIKGYEGLYQISNYGNVYGLKRKKILKPSYSNKGEGWYKQVNLYASNKKPITVRVHILVAQAFLPNPNNHPEINHKDGNKSNAHIDNLEWCTKSSNMKHAYNEGLMIAPKSKEVLQINKLTGEVINKFSSCAEAVKFLNEKYESKANINACARGERKTAFGYVWRFSE